MGTDVYGRRLTWEGCWGPCYTMSSHAALGVVRAGVAVLKGKLYRFSVESSTLTSQWAPVYESIVFHQDRLTSALVCKG